MGSQLLLINSAIKHFGNFVFCTALISKLLHLYTPRDAKPKAY